MMGSDAEAFLNDLGALNLTSADGRVGVLDSRLDGEGVGGRGYSVLGHGRRALTRESDPTQFRNSTSTFFDFTSAGHNHHLPLHQQHQQPQRPAVDDSSAMDLANFSMFAAADKHNINDGGRSDDNVNVSSTGLPQSASSNSSQAHSSNNVNFDALQQLLQMQMQFPSSLSMPASMENASSTNQNHTGSSSNPNTAMLLEQQLRLQQLQQLQQLQNQIFQQQIELISGQSSLSSSLETTPLSANQFQGLPTPANSTELRPQPPPNFVPPMILQNYLNQPGSQAAPAPAHFSTPHQLPQGPSSAPAHLAFSTQTPLLSPGDIDFDLSPLTSPWLGAAQYHQAQQQLQQHTQARTQVQSQGRAERRKRGASSSGDDADGQVQARKRQSPAIRASLGASGSRRATSSRGSVSVSSTPAIRAQQSRRDSFMGEVVGDTPSPVDLSMPPPAPPSQVDNLGSSAANQAQPSMSVPVSASASSSTQGSAGSALSPVTPASIMNLGRLGLGSGLTSSHRTTAEDQQVQEKPSKGKGKSKSPPKSSSAGAGSASTSAQSGKSVSKRGSSTSLVSPSLKPLLPGGLSTTSAAQLGSASNYTHHLSGTASALQIAPSTPLPPPTPAIRKTSHKAAEQKRRDSLKTTFDHLRLLLPPLPLPNEEGYLANGEERLPPGAMPPRGPPRGDVSGPNRSVSKLMLLRCGNEYIKRLKGRVDRRDEYIEELKREVRALRARVETIQIQSRQRNGSSEAEQERQENEAMDDVDVDVDLVAGEIEKVDLEKDLDAEEEMGPRFGLGAARLEAGEDADEECD